MCLRALDVFADTRNERRLRVLLVMPLFVVAGCGSAGPRTPASFSTGTFHARVTSGQSAAISPVRCLSVRITKSNERLNGGVGPRPKRSCASADLQAVLKLMVRLHRALGGSGTICALLTHDYRENAERWAREGPIDLRSSPDEQYRQPAIHEDAVEPSGLEHHLFL